MNFLEYAREWIKDKGIGDKDADYDGALEPVLLAMVAAWGIYGHSGASAHWTVQLFNKLFEDFDKGVPVPADASGVKACCDDCGVVLVAPPNYYTEHTGSAEEKTLCLCNDCMSKRM